MKVFAADFLTDYLKKDIHKYQAHQIESKVSNLSTFSYLNIVEFANQVANAI